jgi:hypothetical protein
MNTLKKIQATGFEDFMNIFNKMPSEIQFLHAALLSETPVGFSFYKKALKDYPEYFEELKPEIKISPTTPESYDGSKINPLRHDEFYDHMFYNPSQLHVENMTTEEKEAAMNSLGFLPKAIKTPTVGDYKENKTVPEMNNLIQVYCTQDESGHWYVIPYYLKDEFNKLCCDDEKEDEFIALFSQYMTGGDLNLKPLYAEL